MGIRHSFVSAIPDDPAAVAAGEVVPSNWNDDHVVPAFFFAEANETAILNAASLANAAGGGWVIIAAGRIQLTGPLPVYNGVIYQGSPLQQDFPGGQTTGAGGTILVGDGTFKGLPYHDNDLAVPPTDYLTFVAGMAKGIGSRDITWENFSYGIKIGGLYNPGMQESYFERNCFVACTQWGMWVENDMLCRYYDNSANNCAVGQFARVGSGHSALNCGNSIWQGTIATMAPDLNCRGIVTWTRGASNLTQISSTHEGSYRTSPSEVVQAATMSAGTGANITVTDGTKFPLDMPMSFSASVNGFTANQVYFVVSQSGNTIQVANSMRGTAIAATGNSAVNAKTKGFAMMEYAGLDAGCSFIGIKITSVDLEGAASTRLVLQDISQDAYLDESIIGSSDCYKSVVRYNCKFGQYNVPTSSIQSDATTSTNNLDFIAGTVSGTRLKLGEISLDYVNSTTSRFNWLDDIFLFRRNTGKLVQANDTNPQEFFVANTYTNSGTDYEVGAITWQAVANRLQIGSFRGGTGVARPVEFVSGGSGFLNYGVNSPGELTTDKVLNSANIYGGGHSAEAGANIIFDKFFSRATVGISYLYNSNGNHYGYTGHISGDRWGVGSSSNGSTMSTTALAWDNANNIILFPQASVTPANNGELVVQATSNTSLTFKYKGSDGTVRSGSITLT